jgi:hypothetical protein
MKFQPIQGGTVGMNGIRSPLKKLPSSVDGELMNRTPYISKSKFLQGL